MARPSPPIISRDSVVERALEIIDHEGLDALTIRRVGSEFGVSSAALYHHFTNKEEIVVGAAELALRRTPTPDADAHSDPEGLLVQGAHLLRDMLGAHPSLLPALVDRERLGIGDRLLKGVQDRLALQGYDRSTTKLCLEVIECLVIGIVYRSVVAPDRSSEIDGTAFTRSVRAVVKAFAPGQPP